MTAGIRKAGSCAPNAPPELPVTLAAHLTASPPLTPRTQRTGGGGAKDWLLASHYRSIRVTVLLAAVLVMSMADLLLTLIYVTQAGLLESNPLARMVMRDSGVEGVVIWKLLTVGLATFIFYMARKRLSGELGLVVSCAVLGWLMIHWTTYIDEVHTITPVLNAEMCADSVGWVSTAPGVQVGNQLPPARNFVLRSDPWDQD